MDSIRPENTESQSSNVAFRSQKLKLNVRSDVISWRRGE